MTINNIFHVFFIQIIFNKKVNKLPIFLFLHQQYNYNFLFLQFFKLQEKCYGKKKTRKLNISVNKVLSSFYFFIKSSES